MKDITWIIGLYYRYCSILQTSSSGTELNMYVHFGWLKGTHSSYRSRLFLFVFLLLVPITIIFLNSLSVIEFSISLAVTDNVTVKNNNLLVTAIYLDKIDNVLFFPFSKLYVMCGAPTSSWIFLDFIGLLRYNISLQKIWILNMLLIV